MVFIAMKGKNRAALKRQLKASPRHLRQDRQDKHDRMAATSQPGAGSTPD
jgi:hypothetical protein